MQSAASPSEGWAREVACGPKKYGLKENSPWQLGDTADLGTSTPFCEYFHRSDELVEREEL